MPPAVRAETISVSALAAPSTTPLAPLSTKPPSRATAGRFHVEQIVARLGLHVGEGELVLRRRPARAGSPLAAAASRPALNQRCRRGRRWTDRAPAPGPHRRLPSAPWSPPARRRCRPCSSAHGDAEPAQLGHLLPVLLAVAGLAVDAACGAAPVSRTRARSARRCPAAAAALRSERNPSSVHAVTVHRYRPSTILAMMLRWISLLPP